MCFNDNYENCFDKYMKNCNIIKKLIVKLYITKSI